MIDLLMERRSIRKFKNVELEADKLDNLVKALLLAPSASNQMPWEFVFVTDRGLLETLATARERGSAFLKDAALGIVLLGESDRRDTWIEDTTIAGILAQLTAHSMGLGSCWVHIRNRMHNDTKTAEQFVKELLEIPEKRSVECIIAVGYPDEQKEPRSEDDLEYGKVYRNKYGLKYR
ncbi:MAG: nitroreductase family protein [Bacillota bacterium]|jgi:nitroreductase|nr:nitroreductase family protein [Bacillota bacterium]MDD3298460.1 nitroreductase family protein [Bacillota bacterium]MDD3850774.1 nitroreductase family protein [Bacillota bacterium]MDD4707310.1 nitroreductase family protein [Bacillota bacterium]